MISGHRRKHASELAGIKEIPAIVKEMSDDEATIFMVDSNIQREKVLPSEKAFAYKMMLEALKRQGKRTDLTSCQVGTKLRADEKIAQETGESARQVQRYVKLTDLIKDILDLVDKDKVGFSIGVELSYLDKKEQEAVQMYETISSNTFTFSSNISKKIKSRGKSHNR